MAHPLTQHPPSHLPFASASRPSPLGFGFGHPSSSIPITFGSQSRSTPSSSGNAPNLGFGMAAASSASSPKKGRLSLQRLKVTPAKTPPSTLKRHRRSSSASDASRIGTSSTPSPTRVRDELTKGRAKDELGVGDLKLGDEERRVIGRKDAKRSRQDIGESPNLPRLQDMDVGVLLAALPPSSHLPILLSLLQSNPSLSAEVVRKIPQPDLHECLAQLERLVDRIQRQCGSGGIRLDVKRLWKRVQKDVETYARTATTYLNFLSSPSTGLSGSFLDPQAIQTLLHALSIHIYQLLHFIPPLNDTSAGPTKALLDLGKSVITSWDAWLAALTDEINQRGGMYPHSLVEGWVRNLHSLAIYNQANIEAPLSSSSTWSFPQPASSQDTVLHPLVESFKSAILPIRDRFLTELGWLIGHRPALSAAFFTSKMGIDGPWGQPTRPITAGIDAQDEDL